MAMLTDDSSTVTEDATPSHGTFYGRDSASRTSLESVHAEEDSYSDDSQELSDDSRISSHAT